MIISKEEFDKLSQLDRIEFRQRHVRLRPSIITHVGMIILIMAGVICSTIYEAAEMHYSEIIMALVVLLVFIVWIIEIFCDTKKYVVGTNELEKEYFKVEVKKKK